MILEIFRVAPQRRSAEWKRETTPRRTRLKIILSAVLPDKMTIILDYTIKILESLIKDFVIFISQLKSEKICTFY